jgi:hypothetical protein
LTLVNKVILRMGLAFIQPAPVGPRPGLHLLRLPNEPELVSWVTQNAFVRNPG